MPDIGLQHYHSNSIQIAYMSITNRNWQQVSQRRQQAAWRATTGLNGTPGRHVSNVFSKQDLTCEDTAGDGKRHWAGCSICLFLVCAGLILLPHLGLAWQRGCAQVALLMHVQLCIIWYIYAAQEPSQYLDENASMMSEGHNAAVYPVRATYQSKVCTSRSLYTSQRLPESRAEVRQGTLQPKIGHVKPDDKAHYGTSEDVIVKLIQQFTMPWYKVAGIFQASIPLLQKALQW